MAVTGTIAAVATVGSAIVGNQQKQKAKGQAGQAQRDADAAQAAADLKVKQAHDSNIQAQAQAGAVARKALGGTIDDAADRRDTDGGTLLTPKPGGGSSSPFVHMPMGAGRKALIGS